jgi:hypothetical protein
MADPSSAFVGATFKCACRCVILSVLCGIVQLMRSRESGGIYFIKGKFIDGFIEVKLSNCYI